MVIFEVREEFKEKVTANNFFNNCMIVGFIIILGLDIKSFGLTYFEELVVDTNITKVI